MLFGIASCSGSSNRASLSFSLYRKPCSRILEWLEDNSNIVIKRKDCINGSNTFLDIQQDEAEKRKRQSYREQLQTGMIKFVNLQAMNRSSPA
ncbi:hypothetical protein SUGI_0649820 [Cryptomeria japonica]|nr:hypothetical protein SUGI_0649820 [Cryptomeria japonica]